MLDLVLVRLYDASYLPMPPFSFDERAHQNYFGSELTTEQIYYRELLRFMMIKHGFTPIKSEWWHFDYKNWRDYEVLAIDFDALN